MIAAQAVATEYAKYGKAEAEYRIAKNHAYVTRRSNGQSQGDAERGSEADSAFTKGQAIAAEGLAKAALELARTTRTRVSSAQSRLGAWREEANLNRTGPMT
jgi:hypothetical protein